MKRSELCKARAAAGDRYSAAMTEFREAFVQLASLDAVLRNRNVGGDDQPTFHLDRTELKDASNCLMHAKYAPEPFTTAIEAVEERTAEIVADFERGSR